MFTSPTPTHLCGELRKEHIGQSVVLGGFLSSFRLVSSKLAFAALRDCTGTTQVKFEFTGDDDEVLSVLKSTPLESSVAVTGAYFECITNLFIAYQSQPHIGVVAARPEATITQDPTGAIEVVAQSFEVVNSANNLPFQYHREITDVVRNLSLAYIVKACITRTYRQVRILN